ncbi:MAG: diguanylate cyclase [Acidobacteriota bacterium]
MAPRRPQAFYLLASGIFALLILSLQLVRVQEGLGPEAGIALEEGQRVEATGPSAWNLISHGAVALLSLALALLALLQRSSDLRARLIAAFSFLIAVELSLPEGPGLDPRTAVLTESLFWLISGAQIAVELHLVSVVPEARAWLSKRWTLPALYASSLGLGGLAWSTYMVEEVRGRGDFFPWSYDHVLATFNNAVLPLWALSVLALLGAPALRHADAKARNQAALIFFGVLPWCLYALAGFAWSVTGSELPAWNNSVFPLLVVFFPLAVFVAIYRYHLFDLELVVRRSFLYTLLTSLVVLFSYAALGVVGMVFSKVIDDAERTSLWVTSAAMFFVGLGFGTLRRFLQRSIDGFLFPARQRMHGRLVALASELPAQGTVTNMGEHLLGHLEEIFSIRASTLLLADPQSGLFFSVASSHQARRRGSEPAHAGESADPFSLSFLLTPDDPALERLRAGGRPLAADKLQVSSPNLSQRLQAMDARLVVPLLHQEALIGVLILGRRSGRRLYRREEIEMLSLFAPQIATAFENIRLFESATYESLTGLLRREVILELLDKEIDRARRHGRPLVVGLADLDFFKSVNDRFGHLAGDAVLKRVAEELAQGLRSADAVGRYGGEEFLLVFPETHLEGGAAVAEKLRRSVESLHLVLHDGASVAPRISIGVAELSALDAPRAEVRRRLLVAADRALYRAKERGRNRVEVLTSEEFQTATLEPLS